MKKNSFIEGTIIATLAIVMVKILGMLYVIPFYATVGEKGSALYGYGYNIYLIFLGISSAGIPVAMSKITNEYATLGMQEAKVRAFKLGKKIISYISIFVFLILFIFAKPIASLIIGDLSGGNTINDVAFIVRCVSFALLVIPYLSVSKGFLQGHKFIAPSSKSQLIEQIVRVLIIIVGSYIAINIFKTSTTFAVGIAILGAFVSGCVAYAYILRKIKNNKSDLSLDRPLKKDKVSDKEILKKIASYAIPFIIINIAANIYNFVDMILILRTLTSLNYNASDVEFITSAITTWGGKLNMIVVAIASGMVISLIPNIVQSFTLKKWNEVSDKLNKAIEIIFFVSLPMVIGLSFLAKPVWTIFYGNSFYGPIIFEVSIFNAIFTNMYMVISSTLQGVNNFKAVYKCSLTGFLVNAILDVPLMLLFNRIGIYPFYGALISTMIGYTLSVIIGLKIIKKDFNIKYKKAFQTCLKILIPTIIMLMSLIVLKMFIPFNTTSKLNSILIVILYTFVGLIAYVLPSLKLNLFKEVLGASYINKIKKKLTKKVS